MNRTIDCQQYEDLTADYLGDELSGADRAAFEAHLAQCPACKRIVDELANSLNVLERLDGLPDQIACDRTQTLQLVRRRSLAARATQALLKTAAVLALGVFVGRYTAGESDASSGENQTAIRFVANSAAPVHPEWLKLANNAASIPSTLAGQLAMIANSGR